MIEMTVESVRIKLQTTQRVVILKATRQERYLLIWIAQAEAYAIAIELTSHWAGQVAVPWPSITRSSPRRAASHHARKQHRFLRTSPRWRAPGP
jgi:hypothetical protein